MGNETFLRETGTTSRRLILAHLPFLGYFVKFHNINDIIALDLPDVAGSKGDEC